MPQYRRFSREEITTLADPVRCANDENNDDDQDWEEEEEGEKKKGEEEQDEVDEEEEPICSLPTIAADEGRSSLGPLRPQDPFSVVGHQAGRIRLDASKGALTLITPKRPLFSASSDHYCPNVADIDA